MTYYDIDGNETTLYKLVRREPEWAMSRIKMGEELADMYSKLERQIDVERMEQAEHLAEKDAEIIKLKLALAEYSISCSLSNRR